MPCTEYKKFSDLTKDNPKGLDDLPKLCNFSNNPGFSTSTQDAIMSGMPGHGETGTIRTGGAGKPSVTFGGSPQRNTPPVAHFSGTPVRKVQGTGSIPNPAPGSTDPFMDGGPETGTSGYNG